MEPRFDVLLMDEAVKFVDSLEEKTRNKLTYNIQKARRMNDPELFKKINQHIWEFRTEYGGNQIRLLAFWDKTRTSYVIGTHGFYKKTQETPLGEIKKAERKRKSYLANHKL